MGRPPHVRCENCCAYESPHCMAFPNDPEWKEPHDWCIRFRADWPGEEKRLRLPELEDCAKCGLRFPKADMIKAPFSGVAIALFWCVKCAGGAPRS